MSHILNNKPFKNSALVRGWKEYKDNHGDLWRRHDQEFKHLFYKLENGCFILQGHLLALRKKQSIKDTHLLFLCKPSEVSDYE